MMKKMFILLVIGLMCLAGQGHKAMASDLQMAVQPDQILKNATYNGREIQVTGSLPVDATAIIRVTGQTEHRKLKKKGRALGILWMNQGSVEVSNVPSVFLFYPPAGGGETGSVPGIGMDALRRNADIESEEADTDALFDEFVKLKQKSGLYGIFPGVVEYGAESGGQKSFHCTLSMPAALPSGTYQVEVAAVKNHAVVSRETQEISVMETGMPAFVSSLAFNHGTLYGVLSVLIAIMAGLLTGLMFKGGKGAH